MEVSFDSSQEDLLNITLPWRLSPTLRLERRYHRIDLSEHVLTQVAALIAKNNSELAGFQPNIAVISTWIFGQYRFNIREDKVSC